MVERQIAGHLQNYKASGAELIEQAGVELDGRGYIRVNERLETSAPAVWASGSAPAARSSPTGEGAHAEVRPRPRCGP